MGLITDKEWKTSGESDYNESQGTLRGFNLHKPGANYMINVETAVESPIPTNVSWNYENTLLDQKFNKWGYYDNDPLNNISIEGTISDNLSSQVKQFERTSPEFLFSANYVRLDKNGLPVTRSSSYSDVYNTDGSKRSSVNYMAVAN